MKLFRTTLIKNRARVDLGRHLETEARWDVGLDQSRDDIHRGPLGRQNQVNTSRPGLLGNPCDELFNLFANDHHHVGELVDHHDDERQRR